MGKRLRIWLADLDLTQQLYSIMFLIMIGISFFYFFYLDTSIDIFADRKMSNELKESAETIKNMSEYSPLDVVIENVSDNSSEHFVYDTNSDEFIYNSDKTGLLDRYSIDYENLEETIIDSNIYYDYLVTVIDDDTYLISMINVENKQLFKDELNSNMININFVVIFAFMFVLMTWINSVIGPLNHMRSYVNKVKNGEKANLKIVRRDEIGVLADGLVNMQKELEKQGRIKEEMIQNISHDLKTPIATIKSYSESIKDGIYPYDSLEKSVDVIYEHADRLEKKVYSLLMLNKMGYLEDTLPPGNNLFMKDVISKVLMSLKVINPEIELIAQVKDDVYFHGEEEPWRIVVENLVDNALRYAKSKVIISTDFDTLTVYNDGRQLEEERIQKLFKPYEKGTDGNFGLGLSIVKRICDTYGYKLSGENLNDGVIFRIQK